MIGITPLVSGDSFGVNLGLFNNNQNSSSENKGWNGRNGDGIKNSSQGGWKIKTNELTSNQVAALNPFQNLKIVNIISPVEKLAMRLLILI